MYDQGRLKKMYMCGGIYFHMELAEVYPTGTHCTMDIKYIKLRG